MICSQSVRGFRKHIRGCRASPPNWKDNQSWLLECVSHGECLSVYGYTLDKTYDES